MNQSSAANWVKNTDQCYNATGPSYKRSLVHANQAGEAPASVFAQVGLELVQEIL